MVYPQRSPNDDQAIDRSLQTNAPIQEQPKLNQEQIFRLIDSILSFEACLYHQILPLALKGNRLTLGMVDPEDTAAIDYVERLLSYMNYCLVSQPLATAAHREIILAYLNHTRATKPATDKLRSIAAGYPAIQTAAKSPEEEIARVSPNDQPTLILDREEELSSLKVDRAKVQNPTPAPSALSQVRENNTRKQSKSQAAQALSALEVQPNHLSSSVEALKNLPPKQLLQELLWRMLEKGIGRLYFEQKLPQCGRIVCSQNGNLQFVLSDIPVQVFQVLISELKRLTYLPLVPVQEPQQVEIERFYLEERLLLRLQVMPGTYGDRATLQVLRGAALQFYQQQQLAHMSRDAVAIALALQQKLHQLRNRAKLSASFHSEQYKSLMALNQILQSVEQQLENLKNLPA